MSIRKYRFEKMTLSEFVQWLYDTHNEGLIGDDAQTGLERLRKDHDSIETATQRQWLFRFNSIKAEIDSEELAVQEERERRAKGLTQSCATPECLGWVAPHHILCNMCSQPERTSKEVPVADERDKYEITIKQPSYLHDVRIVLVGLFAACTRCEGIFPVSKFGLRTMNNGALVRSQAQCISCRSKGPKG